MSWQTILDNFAEMIPYANHFITATSFLFLCTVLAHWILPSRQPLPMSRKLFDTILSLVAIALWVWVSTFQSGSALLIVVFSCALFLSFWISLSISDRFQYVSLGESRKADARKQNTDDDDDERKKLNDLFAAMSEDDKEKMLAIARSKADERKKEKK